VRKEIEVDEGSRFYEKKERIPLLSDALEEIKGKLFFVDIEIKPNWFKRKTEREVAKIVRASAIENQVVCSSFDFLCCIVWNKEHRSIYSGFAYDNNMPVNHILPNRNKMRI